MGTSQEVGSLDCLNCCRKAHPNFRQYHSGSSQDEQGHRERKIIHAFAPMVFSPVAEIMYHVDDDGFADITINFQDYQYGLRTNDFHEPSRPSVQDWVC